MIKIFLFCALLLGLINVGCNQGSGQSTAKKESNLPLDIFVFVDKSKSVSFDDSSISKKCSDAVKALLDQMQHPGDRISLYYIHKNTSGAGAEYSYFIPPIDLGKNTNTIEKNERRHNQALAALGEKKKVFAKLQNMLHVLNNIESEKGTDIIGVLEVVSNKSDASHDKRIVMLTDGIQDTKDFCKVEPRNNQEANSRSAQDIARIPANYSIQKTCLANARAQMVLPFSAIASTHNKFLDNYWENIFKFYGMSFSCE